MLRTDLKGCGQILLFIFGVLAITPATESIVQLHLGLIGLYNLQLCSDTTNYTLWGYRSFDIVAMTSDPPAPGEHTFAPSASSTVAQLSYTVIPSKRGDDYAPIMIICAVGWGPGRGPEIGRAHV